MLELWLLVELMVVGGLGLGGWDVVEFAVEAAMVEPLDASRNGGSLLLTFS